MTVLLASLDYILPVIPKDRTASYHGRKHSLFFVRTMLALTLLRFVPTIRMQTDWHVRPWFELARVGPVGSMNPSRPSESRGSHKW